VAARTSVVRSTRRALPARVDPDLYDWLVALARVERWTLTGALVWVTSGMRYFDVTLGIGWLLFSS